MGSASDDVGVLSPAARTRPTVDDMLEEGKLSPRRVVPAERFRVAPCPLGARGILEQLSYGRNQGLLGARLEQHAGRG